MDDLKSGTAKYMSLYPEKSTDGGKLLLVVVDRVLEYCDETDGIVDLCLGCSSVLHSATSLW